MHLTDLPRLAPAVALLAASCAYGPFGGTTGGPAYDGVYRGEFALERAMSPDSCPNTATGQATMVVRGGDARADMARGAYFSGRVGASGDLTLISGASRLAFVTGRIAGGVYAAHGNAECQYVVRLRREVG